MKYKEAVLERWKISYNTLLKQMEKVIETDGAEALQIGIKLEQVHNDIINMIEETSGGTINPNNK